VPFLRHRNSRPDVISHPLPALSVSYGSEDVKTRLEPVVEAMSDLHSFMLGVTSGIKAIHNCLRAVDREIAMEFEHGMTLIDQIRSIHLNFIVILGTGESCSEDQDEEKQNKVGVAKRLTFVHIPRSNAPTLHQR